GLPIGGLTLVALLSLITALLFRRGLIMRALGVEIVSVDGAPASRGRTFWRALIAWSPVWLGPILLSLVIPALDVTMQEPKTPADQPTLSEEQHVDADVAFLESHTKVLLATIVGTCGTVWLALVVWSLSLPGRGIQDRLARTWLVPE